VNQHTEEICMNPSDLYTCSTAAAKLGVTPVRVRALIASQRLKATLFGHVWLIEAAALDAVLSRKSGRPQQNEDGSWSNAQQAERGSWSTAGASWTEYGAESAAALAGLKSLPANAACELPCKRSACLRFFCGEPAQIGRPDIQLGSIVNVLEGQNPLKPFGSSLATLSSRRVGSSSVGWFGRFAAEKKRRQAEVNGETVSVLTVHFSVLTATCSHS
jgi:hypothetical protein